MAAANGNNDDVARVDRNAVLTLWAAVVAERRGYDIDEALSIAGAFGKLPLFQDPAGSGPAPSSHGVTPLLARQRRTARLRDNKTALDILQRRIAVAQTRDGIRALAEPHATIEPARVASYLRTAFGDQLQTTCGAMRELAAAYSPSELDDRATELYAKFRPELPEDAVGWGAEAHLHLSRIAALAHEPT